MAVLSISIISVSMAVVSIARISLSIGVGSRLDLGGRAIVSGPLSISIISVSMAVVSIAIRPVTVAVVTVPSVSISIWVGTRFLLFLNRNTKCNCHKGGNEEKCLHVCPLAYSSAPGLRNQ